MKSPPRLSAPGLCPPVAGLCGYHPDSENTQNHCSGPIRLIKGLWMNEHLWCNSFETKQGIICQTKDKLFSLLHNLIHL